MRAVTRVVTREKKLVVCWAHKSVALMAAPWGLLKAVRRVDSLVHPLAAY
jgi:hypothetical protein